VSSHLATSIAPPNKVDNIQKNCPSEFNEELGEQVYKLSISEDTFEQVKQRVKATFTTLRSGKAMQGRMQAYVSPSKMAEIKEGIKHRKKNKGKKISSSGSSSSSDSSDSPDTKKRKKEAVIAESKTEIIEATARQIVESKMQKADEQKAAAASKKATAAETKAKALSDKKASLNILRKCNI